MPHSRRIALRISSTSSARVMRRLRREGVSVRKSYATIRDTLVMSGSFHRPLLFRRMLVIVACVALATFYVAAASEHGRRVNTSKARGDQSGYLWDAENVYANWHGRQPPT